LASASASSSSGDSGISANSITFGIAWSPSITTIHNE